MGAPSVKMRTAMAIALLRPCLLCGSHADAVGVFEPDEGHLNVFRARQYVYPICADCLSSDTVREQVEERLAA